MQNQNEPNACPQCGGGPVTWKCTCEPMWRPTAVVLDEQAALSHSNEEAIAKQYDLDESTVRDLWNEFTAMVRAAFPQPVAQPVEQTRALTVEQKAALDLAVLNLKSHGDDQLLAAVTPLIDFYARSLTAARPASGETD